MPATPQSPDRLANYRYLNFTNFEDGITAKAGGGQSTAYQLSAQVSVIDTVATTADSVALPKYNPFAPGDARPGAPGQIVVVVNNGANACQVFGVTPDTINDVATATGVTLAAGATMFAWPMVAASTGDWFSMIVPSPSGVGGVAPLRFSSIPIGDTAYSSLGTNTTDINGQVWVTSIFIPMNKAITKLGFLQGGTATTDNTVLGIYNSAGTLIGNSAVAGVVLSGANTFQEQALLTAITLTGPAVYFLSVQGNGTAAGAIRTVATSTFVGITSAVVAGTFGTLPAITVPTTFTAGQAPIMYVF